MKIVSLNLLFSDENFATIKAEIYGRKIDCCLPATTPLLSKTRSRRWLFDVVLPIFCGEL